MRHLHVTNEAIVPVLNVTRLKAIKGAAFASEHRASPKSSANEDKDSCKSSEEEKNIEQILELSKGRRVLKP